jgi:hypothetical protein
MQGTQAIGLAMLLGALTGGVPLAAQTAASPEVPAVTSDTAWSSAAWAAERAKMVQAVAQDLETLHRTDAIASATAHQFIFLNADAILLRLEPVADPVERRKARPVRVQFGRSKDS